MADVIVPEVAEQFQTPADSDLFECKRCNALVNDPGRRGHADWHRMLADQHRQALDPSRLAYLKDPIQRLQSAVARLQAGK